MLDYGVITFKDTDAKVGYSYGQWNFKTPDINLAFDNPDVWKFSNSLGAFGLKEASDGYYITSNDYNRLVSQLSNTEKKKISSSLLVPTYNIDGKNDKNINWIGSCYGMSIWVCLASRGIRNAEEISTGYPNLYRVEYPFKNKDIASAINYYQQQQRLSGNIMQQNEFMMNLSQDEQIKVLERVARKAGDKGEYGLILMEWREGVFATYKHAIVVYGYEDGTEWSVNANGITKTYTKRALIYDCSSPYSNTFDEYCIYFDDYSWCIPGWNITSTFNDPSAKVGNGHFCLITDDVEVLNTVDFASGNISTKAYSDSILDVLLGLGAGSTFKVHTGNNFCAVENGEIVESSFEDQLNIIFDAAVPAEGAINTSQAATLVLHNPDSTYTISTKEPICYDIKYANYYMMASSDTSGSVEFLPNGGVRLNGDTDADYTLQLVADDGYHTLPWYEVSITGDNSTNISAEWVTGGVKISGDNLDNIKINASDDQETVELELDTDYNDVLIKDDDGSLGAYVDTDHDGIFETPVEKDDERPSGSSDGDSAPAVYSVHVDNTKHGTVSVNRRAVYRGEKVTITVVPDQNYKLDNLSVVDKSGNSIKVDRAEDKYTFKMPACDVTVSAAFVKVTTEYVFDDVGINDYYCDAVLWAVEQGITNGISATTFGPDIDCTRSQVVTFLWRAAGSPEPKSNTMPFLDVSPDAYYYDAVLWAVEQGITTGTTESTFSPELICTRSQVVTLLWRAAGSPEAENVDVQFSDVPSDEYYSDAVLWAVEHEITSGTSASTFGPLVNCTRAQIVTFLWRCYAK